MPWKYPDIVVVVPGLIGSVLSKDGKPLWGTSPGALYRILRGEAMRQLALTGTDDETDDIGDGIVATALVDNVEILPGLWKQGGYSRLQSGLVDGVGLIPGENYFVFPYDWRRSNRVSARRLAAFVPARLKAWREKSGNAEAKVVFVVHSMGGLVARHYVECLEGWKIARTILSFGTPYKGSGNALGFLCNGFTWKIGPVEAFDGTDALRSFDSVYQLLPTYRFVKEPGQDLKRVFELDLPNLDRTRATAAHAFHDEIRVAQEANSRSDEYGRTGPRVRPVIGTEQPTVQSAAWDGRTLTMLMRHDDMDQSGDGTVPRVSALPLELDFPVATYVPNTHSALQSDEASFGHMRGVLTESGVDPRTFRAGEAETFSLYVEDAYRAGRPVRIEATASDHLQAIEAQVDRVDESVPSTWITLRPSADGRYRCEVPLDSGVYRVKLSAERFHTVEDVFLVSDD
ncbi:esterase/lipase family protein [Bradyrhizobium sp. USDA 329]|uniref:esterase/lipase family protein n=1 Tax=unclassified Bradyrhizobium TaxID=2631580 RepID=UPI003513186D